MSLYYAIACKVLILQRLTLAGLSIHLYSLLLSTWSLHPAALVFFPISYICAQLVVISGLSTSHSSSLMCLAGVPMNYLSLPLLGLAWQGLGWLELPVSHFQTQRVPGRSRVWQWPHGPLGGGRQWRKCSMDPPQHTVANETLHHPDSYLSSQPQSGSLPGVDKWPWCVQFMLQVPKQVRHMPKEWAVKGCGGRSPRAPGGCSCRSGSKSWPHIAQMLLPSGW